ncbi:MAG: type II toxin-antitoxin system death-on-curing family toxin [Kiloniellaceae bacterium]
MEPVWLTSEIVRAIHSGAVAEFGGAPGLRDPGLFDSAMERAPNLSAYGDDPSLYDLAAAYCAGIVKNHAFVDGNKRAGVLAAVAFLDLNGCEFRPEEGEVVNVILALAAGEIEENVLTEWFSDNSTPKRD